MNLAHLKILKVIKLIHPKVAKLVYLFIPKLLCWILLMDDVEFYHSLLINTYKDATLRKDNHIRRISWFISSGDCKIIFLCRKYNYSIVKNYKHQPLICINCTLFFTQRCETVNGTTINIIGRNRCSVYFLLSLKTHERNFSWKMQIFELMGNMSYE